MKIRITVSARALIDDTGELVVDLAELKKLDGTTYDSETFSDYLIDDPDAKGIPVSGGHLHFYYDDDKNELFAFTEYTATRELTPNELDGLVRYTRGQWSDGIGENFSQEHADETGILLEPESEQTPVVEVVP